MKDAKGTEVRLILDIKEDDHKIILWTQDKIPVYVVGKIYSNTSLEVGFIANGLEDRTLRLK